VLKFAKTGAGNPPPTNVTVFPVEVPVNDAVQVVAEAGFNPIVKGSTLAIVLILQEGPASYPERPKILVTKS
jgi:hypothetical protein